MLFYSNNTQRFLVRNAQKQITVFVMFVKNESSQNVECMLL